MTINDKDVVIFDEYTQEGYGVINKKIVETIGLLAKTEGIFLDPVYTAKAMMGLIDLVKKGFFKKSENILFLHTGGMPLLFPYKRGIIQFLRK